jgi:hypothetical protein
MRCTVTLAIALTMVACGKPAAAPAAADAAAATRRLDDSVISIRTQQAAAIADTARRTVAVLLKHPESATFDSLVVMQPPKDGDHWPTPVVCGRIGGKPGIGGSAAMTPFIYQSRINVFLLDHSNAAAFSALRARSCDNPGARVLSVTGSP